MREAAADSEISAIRGTSTCASADAAATSRTDIPAQRRQIRWHRHRKPVQDRNLAAHGSRRICPRSRGMRPRLPSSTGSATAMLFSTDVRCICLLSKGIMADIVPNTAKHNAKAPVANDNCNCGDVCLLIISVSKWFNSTIEDQRHSQETTTVVTPCKRRCSGKYRSLETDFLRRLCRDPEPPQIWSYFQHPALYLQNLAFTQFLELRTVAIESRQ